MDKISKLEIFKTMLGESHSDFVAASLKECYEDLYEELTLLQNGDKRSVIWSYDDEEETEELQKMLNALRTVYSWYSSKDLECIKN